MMHALWKMVRQAASSVAFFYQQIFCLPILCCGSVMVSRYKGKKGPGSNKDFLSTSQTSTVTEVMNYLCSQQDIK
jgi:hypothetical protein